MLFKIISYVIIGVLKQDTGRTKISICDNYFSCIKQIISNEGTTLVSEGIDANYFDILNYAVFALILIAEGKQPK